MNRRQLLKLGLVASGTFAVGGLARLGTRTASAQIGAVPTVDRLVLTNVVDNIYDVFAKAGRLDTITVQRTPVGPAPLLAEHGLAYHIESHRGAEQRQILLDFSLTDINLFNNYQSLKVDPYAADALILSHGHRDHYGALPALARVGQGKFRTGITVYAGGEDTFCAAGGGDPHREPRPGSARRAGPRGPGAAGRHSRSSRRWWPAMPSPRARSPVSPTSSGRRRSARLVAGPHGLGVRGHPLRR